MGVVQRLGCVGRSRAAFAIGSGTPRAAGIILEYLFLVVFERAT